MNGWIIAVVVGAIGFGFFGLWVSIQKCRSPVEGFVIGLLFGPLGVVVEAILPQGAVPAGDSASFGTANAGRSPSAEDGRRGAAWLWPAFGIPLAAVAGLLWVIVIRASKKIMDDFGAELPPLTQNVLDNMWLWAISLVLVSSACLLGRALAETARGALAARLAVLLVAAFYLLIAVLACGLPLLKLVRDLS
jgi:hypothetical protein